MEKIKKRLEYESPDSSVIVINDDGLICLSGNHERVYEEDWIE